MFPLFYEENWNIRRVPTFLLLLPAELLVVLLAQSFVCQYHYCWLLVFSILITIITRRRQGSLSLCLCEQDQGVNYD